MEINVKVGIKVKDDIYNMDLNIPTTSISKEKPFKFAATVTHDKKIDVVLHVVYGSKDYFRVAVAPPKSLLSGLGEYVDAMEVVVQEGTVTDKVTNADTVELTQLPDKKPDELPEYINIEVEKDTPKELCTNKPKGTKK